MKLIVDGVYTTEIDEEDLPIYLSHTWKIRLQKNKPYVVSSRTRQGLHRILLNGKEFCEKSDHIDGNTLNNKRSNLRLTTNRINSQNTEKYRNKLNSSKYIGVTKSWFNSWKCRTSKKGKIIYIGSYPTEELAAKAYDEYMTKHFEEKDRGLLNFQNTPLTQGGDR